MIEPLRILWCDEHLVAVYKPAGWLVHRTGLDAGETRFVVQTLRNQLGGQHVFPAHRLDKGTCGVLLFARHRATAQTLALAFADHRVKKRYLALVRGWVPEVVEVNHPLRPDDAGLDAPVQEAHTQFRRVARLELPEASDSRFTNTRASLVEAIPTTGRRHQIRRHLKFLAHPIIGDATHGKGPLNRWWAERLALQRLWLHAWSLEFAHPITGEQLEVRSGMSMEINALADAHCCADGLGDWNQLVQRREWIFDGTQWRHSTPTGVIRRAITLVGN